MKPWRLGNDILSDDSTAGVGQRAHYLNGLAYTRAVGRLELAAGLISAEEAVAIAVNRVAQLDPAGLLHFGRGCTAAQRDDEALALTSFNEAAKSAGDLYQHNVARVQALASVPREALSTSSVPRSCSPTCWGS